LDRMLAGSDLAVEPAGYMHWRHMVAEAALAVALAEIALGLAAVSLEAAHKAVAVVAAHVRRHLDHIQLVDVPDTL